MSSIPASARASFSWRSCGSRAGVLPVVLAGAAFAALASAPMRAQSTELVSVADDGSLPDGDCDAASVTDDGRRVVFASTARNLVAGDRNGVADIFLRDRVAVTTQRVSVSSAGAEADDASWHARVSGDGNFVAFSSVATNLVAGDDNHSCDVFVRDVAHGTTTLASVAYDGHPTYFACSDEPAISADGRFVAFMSTEPKLVPFALPSGPHVFLRDLLLQTTVLVAADSAGHAENGTSDRPEISRDGRFVVFTSTSTNLDGNDTDKSTDLYLRDFATGTTVLVGVASDGTKGDGQLVERSVSDDGRFVAFCTDADNLWPGDAPLINGCCGTWDVFVRDVALGTTTCASVDSDGHFSDLAFIYYWTSGAAITGDGRFVFFSTSAWDLVPGDGNSSMDALAHERDAAVTTLASLDASGAPLAFGGSNASASRDGSFVAFTGAGGDVDFSLPADRQVVFLRQRPVDPAETRSFGTGWSGSHGVPSLTASGPPTLHSDLALTLGNSYGRFTVALLLLGTVEVQWPTGFGGDLLVDPTFSVLVPVAPGGSVVTDQVPVSDVAAGVVLALQFLEIDPGASEGIAFSAGLELTLGY